MWTSSLAAGILLGWVIENAVHSRRGRDLALVGTFGVGAAVLLLFDVSKRDFLALSFLVQGVLLFYTREGFALVFRRIKSAIQDWLSGLKR